MKIKLDIYSREDLEMQCNVMLRLLKSGKNIKDIKRYIERSKNGVMNRDNNQLMEYER